MITDEDNLIDNQSHNLKCLDKYFAFVDDLIDGLKAATYQESPFELVPVPEVNRTFTPCQITQADDSIWDRESSFIFYTAKSAVADEAANLAFAMSQASLSLQILEALQARVSLFYALRDPSFWSESEDQVSSVSGKSRPVKVGFLKFRVRKSLRSLRSSENCSPSPDTLVLRQPQRPRTPAEIN